MPEVLAQNLQVNSTIEAPQNDPTLIVTVDPNKPLSVGTYVFQLQVIDDANNPSQPARVKILVVDDQAPNARIDAPERVGFAQSFTLSGKPSFDVGGAITRYIWTLVQQP